jgi:hypothetical protein
MTYSDKWLRLCEAEEAYRIRQNEFLQDHAQMARDLEQALAGAEGNLTAMQLVVDLKPDVETLTPLLPQMLGLALDSSSSDRIVLAREVLAVYKDDRGFATTSRC